MPIPDLDHSRVPAEGILPAGVHRATIEEIEDVFVGGIAGSMTRQRIFRSWSLFNDQIAALVEIRQEFINGSFVTSRKHPNDIDFSVWIRADDLDGLSEEGQRRFFSLWEQRMATYRCDAYLVPECGPGHAQYFEFSRQRTMTETYWGAYKDVTGFVRPNIEKGYIEVIQ